MISANQIQTAATEQNDFTVRAAVDAVNGFTIAITLAAPAVAVAAIGYGAYKIWQILSTQILTLAKFSIYY
jgi:hypothetical protein